MNKRLITVVWAVAKIPRNASPLPKIFLGEWFLKQNSIHRTDYHWSLTDLLLIVLFSFYVLTPLTY